MKTTPILFSGPMVKAILDGRKTMTRRVVKLDEQGRIYGKTHNRSRTVANLCDGIGVVWRPFGGSPEVPMPEEEVAKTFCPYGTVGDRLWVRETWRESASSNHYPKDSPNEHRTFVEYKATWNGCRDTGAKTVLVDHARYGGDLNADGGIKWRPSIHMPRWASRITLEITGVRVERVQDISAKDIIAEGVVDRPHKVECLSGDCPVSAVDGICYPDLRSVWYASWAKINGMESLKQNPWVWVVSFRRVTEAA